MSPFLSDFPKDIAGFLIPMKPHDWLIPNVAVEEILLKPPIMHRVKKTDSDKEFFVWHGYSIPVMYADDLSISFASDETVDSRYSHMIILHSMVEKRIFYFALVIKALPRLVWVMPQDLVDLEKPILQPTESALVQFFDQTLAIPNLTYLENKAVEYIGRG